jgi:hypothetical protein
MFENILGSWMVDGGWYMVDGRWYSMRGKLLGFTDKGVG